MFNQNIIVQILIFYCLLTVIIYFTSDFMIFPYLRSSYRDTPEIIKLITADGKKISAIYLNNPKAKYTVLFSHGNYEDIGTLLPYLKEYQAQGFSILAYDYHGYGTSEGRASENATYLDINAAYQYLISQLHIPPSHIILHGRSLGSGPSLDLAIRESIGGLILESPMLTMFRVITQVPLFPVDKYYNDQKITKLTVPLLVIHGKKDEVIPFWHGKKLYEKAKSPKTFLELENAGHNDILSVEGEHYWRTIKKFADLEVDSREFHFNE